MNKAKRIIALMSALAMTVTLMAGCGGGKQPASGSSGQSSAAGSQSGASSTPEGPIADPVTAKLGLSYSDNHTITKELYVMAENVKERTNGGVNIEIYADSILGSDVQLYEQQYMGTLEMSLQSVSAQNTKHPELVFEDLPYLYASADEAHKALDGEVGEIINKIIASDGVLHNLGFMELGFRQVTNSVRPITKPEDFAGIKMRVNSSQLRVDTFEAFGAQAIIMSMGEVFTALQQHVVDGQESPLATIISSSLQEVQHYCSLTNHFYTSSCLLVNDAFFNSLPQEWQDIITEECAAAVLRIREANVAEQAEQIQFLKDAGVEVNEVTDIAPFKALLDDVYAQYEPIVGEELMNAYHDAVG